MGTCDDLSHAPQPSGTRQRIKREPRLRTAPLPPPSPPPYRRPAMAATIAATKRVAAATPPGHPMWSTSPRPTKSAQSLSTGSAMADDVHHVVSAISTRSACRGWYLIASCSNKETKRKRKEREKRGEEKREVDATARHNKETKVGSTSTEKKQKKREIARAREKKKTPVRVRGTAAPSEQARCTCVAHARGAWRSPHRRAAQL